MLHADRVAQLESLKLLPGSHEDPNEGMCVMEAVAWVTGERHCAHPACACPTLSAFMRRWNDDLDEAGRQRLKRYIVRLVGTTSTREVEQRRGWMAADWLVRVHTPAWLRLAKLDDQAAALEALPELANVTTLHAARDSIYIARDRATAAGDAAWAAAWEKLEPTKLSLQQSALQLLDRMLAVK